MERPAELTPQANSKPRFINANPENDVISLFIASNLVTSPKHLCFYNMGIQVNALNENTSLISWLLWHYHYVVINKSALYT